VRKSKTAVVAALAAAATAVGCGMPAVTVAGTGRPEPSPLGGAAVSGGHVPGPPVRDGGFEFTVLDVSRADQVGELDDPGLFVTARGVFVVITLGIRNVSKSPLTFVDRDQTLIDRAGREFQTSMAANIYGNLAIPSTRISPAGDLVVKIAFDVPAGAAPRNLVLRESASSDGVAVPVS